LTYGLVISALMFLSLMAIMRFFIPWQRVWGLIQSRLPSNETVQDGSKDFIQFDA
jgi:hypothetical protein